MHSLDVDDGTGTVDRLVLRRYARTDMPPDIGVVENEAAALGVIESTAIPAPRLVATDPRGTETDVPALLMTRLTGRDNLAPQHLDSYVEQLATTLRAIHSVAVPSGHLNYYRPWSLDVVTEPPPWTTRPGVWKDAITIANGPVPEHDRVLLHRDFHPGNVLWNRDRVSGVVDWTHACRGPAAADVAHCRLNLAILFGRAAVDDFTRHYGEVADLAWHDIVDAVSTAGEHEPDTWRWHDAGRADITAEGVVASRDEHLANAVNRFRRTD
jgi:aminoglycoside phosphotransferase (APT) family kinase protein